MKYTYPSRARAREYEKAILDFWRKNDTFQKSIENRSKENAYVFYDGPPFITGVPHYGTLLSSIVKDAVPRFWTMNGKRVERVWGWDCHGLPAENFVEQKLGITDRRQIDTGKQDGIEKKINLEDYIITARESMVATAGLWEGTIDRIGRWVDMKNAYKTMDKDFMESVWWAFKTLYEKGKIYEGLKVLMYDTKFATPVSKNEVTMDNDAYQTVTDPSAYVKFRVKNSSTYLLAWTTTPWTLLANVALAVNPDSDYILAEIDNEKFYLAKSLAEKSLRSDKNQPLAYKTLASLKGKDLVGLEYEFPYSEGKVFAADFVGESEGTGIVHIAPAYGEDDFALSQAENLPVKDVLDEYGHYLEGDWAGQEIWSVNKEIAKTLKENGAVFRIDYIQHEYPFNPRSKSRIIYRAYPSWFFDIENSKPLMLEQNESINWFPGHIKEGRFRKNIESAPDWNLSRDRFWATAMPVWKGDKGTVKVIGSYAELKELSGVELEDYHRPWVDRIEFDQDGEHFTRVDKVLDCWFESGSMPFAQLHYPFENKEEFEANYPADFIVEYVAQVRAWFYYVHAVNTALFGEKAFKNVIVTGTVAGNDGRKMSKSLGNFTDPNTLMDTYSADSIRFLLLSSPLLSGEDFALTDKDVSDTARKLTMLWNVYDFFTMYASVDHFESHGFTTPDLAELKNPLDIWIISRVHELRDQITQNMEGYNIPDALAPVLPTIDDLCNWFVRRSRRRFWKSEDDADKHEAYVTLHYVLSYFAIILAPFVPFLAEELWQKMVGEGSVHLLDWPAPGAIDRDVLDKMSATRKIVELGLMQRMQKSETENQVKVRQPLSELSYGGVELDDFYRQIIADEVNVKQVKDGYIPDESQPVTNGECCVYLDKTLTPELKEEGFIRDLIRCIQNARKNAKLEVDDRIHLSISIDIPALYLDLIKSETLALVVDQNNYKYDEIIEIDGQKITLSLEKA